MPVVFITGATAGFGAACARRFAREGWSVAATGRKPELLAQLAGEIAPAPVHAAVLDVRDKAAVQAVVDGLPPAFREVDLLINNAGLALGLEPAYQASLEDWEVMVDTNIKGLLYCTRALLPGMVERKRGHVVNLGSIAGSYPYPGGNVYGATKAFVKQLSLNLRCELYNTRVRVTDIEPGMADTNFSPTRFKGDSARAAKVYEGMSPLTAEDVAEAIYWTASLPWHVNVSRLELWPTQQAPAFFNVDREQ
ncbi:MAG: SDR family NAD(P)-dependent oxidoreductase [Thermodesulfobacteriota bacterium]